MPIATGTRCSVDRRIQTGGDTLDAHISTRSSETSRTAIPQQGRACGATSCVGAQSCRDHCIQCNIFVSRQSLHFCRTDCIALDWHLIQTSLASLIEFMRRRWETETRTFADESVTLPPVLVPQQALEGVLVCAHFRFDPGYILLVLPVDTGDRIDGTADSGPVALSQTARGKPLGSTCP